MVERLILQYATLVIYCFFLGITFCDGFKLPNAKKLVVFLTLLAISIAVIRRTGELRLELILPIPTLIAFAFGWGQIKKNRELR